MCIISTVFIVISVSGCGKMIAREATSQLLISDSVDRAVASIDFSELSGKKIYFDTEFLKPVKEIGFVNSPYVIGSLRQQMIASGCLLQDKKEDAELIIEGRIGALGADQHEVIYGVPANNLLNAASSVVATLPPLPTIPEISVAKKDDQMAAAKIALIAYDRETRIAVWQSGISQARSTARSEWLLGAGPFQRGTIYRHTRFAGSRIGYNLPLVRTPEESDGISSKPYFNARSFARMPIEKPTEAATEVTPSSTESNGQIVPVKGEESESTSVPQGNQTPEKIDVPPDAKPVPGGETNSTSNNTSAAGSNSSATVKANFADSSETNPSEANATEANPETSSDERSAVKSQMIMKSPFEKIWLFPPRAAPQ